MTFVREHHILQSNIVLLLLERTFESVMKGGSPFGIAGIGRTPREERTSRCKMVTYYGQGRERRRKRQAGFGKHQLCHKVSKTPRKTFSCYSLSGTFVPSRLRGKTFQLDLVLDSMFHVEFQKGQGLGPPCDPVEKVLHSYRTIFVAVLHEFDDRSRSNRREVDLDRRQI